MKIEFCLTMLTAALLFCGCGEPKTPEQIGGEALAAAKAGQWESCVESCDGLLTLAPDSAPVLVLKSIALNNMGDRAAAMSCARRATEIDPGNFQARYMVGYLASLEPGGERRAIDELTRALQMEPDSVKTLLLLGDCGSRLNDDDTEFYLALLPQETAGTAAVRSRLAIHYILRGRKSEAARAFADAYMADSANPVTVLNLARYLDYYAGDPTGACNRYGEFLKMTANNAEFTGLRTLVEGRLNALRR
ncbi:MAG: hypothetical protein PHI85_00060 [Victivallaceae bacterium]|nr:hypothetical protein [Victivallaceae bacterium]